MINNWRCDFEVTTYYKSGYCRSEYKCYPTPKDYNQALKNFKKMVKDKSLNIGHIVVHQKGTCITKKVFPDGIY